MAILTERCFKCGSMCTTANMTNILVDIYKYGVKIKEPRTVHLKCPKRGRIWVE